MPSNSVNITKIATLLRKSDIDALTRLTNHRHKLLFSHNPTPDTSMTYIQNSLDTNESSKNKPMVIWLLVFKKFPCIAAWYNIFAVKLTPVAFCMTEPKNRKEDKLQIERTCFYFSWLHVSQRHIIIYTQPLRKRNRLCSFHYCYISITILGPHCTTWAFSHFRCIIV